MVDNMPIGSNGPNNVPDSQKSVPVAKKDSSDISVWLKDNGNGTFDKEDIIDENLKNDNRFWDTVKNLVGKPLDDICKGLLEVRKSLYDLNYGPCPVKEKSPSEIQKEKIEGYFNQGLALGREIEGELKGIRTDVENVKTLFGKITPENVAYVVRGCSGNIAEKIDDVFAWGNGFDKKDVYNNILSKLITRAEQLGLEEKIEEARGEIWASPYSDTLDENSSLEDMKNAIHVYKSVIFENEYKPIL